MKKLLAIIVIAFIASSFSASATTGMKGSGIRTAFVSGLLIHTRQPLPVSVSVSAAVTTSSITIPVLIHYTATNGMYAEATPQIGFLFSSKKTFEGVTNKAACAAHAGWCFGAGYELRHAAVAGLGINMRYSVGLTTINRVANKEGKLKNRMMAVGITYRLGVRAAKSVRG